MKKLQELNINVNRLMELQDGVFDGLESLRRLYIRGNVITTLQPTVFANLPRPLRHEVGYNPLQCDPCYVRRRWQVPLYCKLSVQMEPLGIARNCSGTAKMASRLLGFCFCLLFFYSKISQLFNKE